MTSRTEYCTQTPNKPSLFDVQYLRNHRTFDVGVLGYIGIVWPKEHSPEVRSFPPGTPCIYLWRRPTQYSIHSSRLPMIINTERIRLFEKRSRCLLFCFSCWNLESYEWNQSYSPIKYTVIPNVFLLDLHISHYWDFRIQGVSRL